MVSRELVVKLVNAIPVGRFALQEALPAAQWHLLQTFLELVQIQMWRQ